MIETRMSCNNQEKGLFYEKYVRDFIIENLHKNAYLWNECPENILINNNLICSHNSMRLYRKDLKEGNMHSHKDIGIDVIQIEDKIGETNNSDGTYICSMIQCKNGYANGITIENIAGIMIRTAAQDTNAFIYYTDKLSPNIKYVFYNSKYAKFLNEQKLIEVVNDDKYEFDAKMKYFVKLPIKETTSTQDSEISEMYEMKAYNYQIDAVEAFKKHFTDINKKRGILSLPCGCGKTFTSYLISREYGQVVILSPLRAFADQNLKRFIEYGYDKDKALLVDSDGERDILTVKQFINENTKLLISTTYKSMDVISECLADLNVQNTLFIIDEFHNLTKSNIYDNDNPIFKLLMSDHRIIFMSATPRIYEMEDAEETYDMEFLFGERVYNMTMNEAIQNNNICDYRIWLPSIHENNTELDKELSVYEIDDTLKNRCKYLYSCLANNGSRKCIVYCRDTEDMKAMIECMATLNEFYIMNIEVNSICCEDSEMRRKSSLDKFSDIHSNKIQLLFNIKILNECIDIPACDAVYISYSPKNKITTIQRICRANRKMANNPHKIANIFIWCDEYADIFNTLSSIKEFDCMFKDKIKLNTVDFFNSKDKKDIDLVEADRVLLQNYTIDVKEFRAYSWQEKFEMLIKYVESNGILPLISSSDNKIKQLGVWVSTQKLNYKNGLLKDENVKKLWEEFVEQHPKLFQSNKEKWLENLQSVKNYINQYNKLPSQLDKNFTAQNLGHWICTQKQKINKGNIAIMQNEDIRNIWEEFVKDYKKFFKTWNDKLEETILYIEKNKVAPSPSSKDATVKKLGSWLYNQLHAYKNNEKMNLTNKKLLEEFNIKYSLLFTGNNAYWNEKLNKLEEYIIHTNKLPNNYDKDVNVKMLSKWLHHQKYNYKNNLMRNNELKDAWKTFTDKYSDLFKSREEIWNDNLLKVQEFIKINGRLPPLHKEVLATWLNSQKRNYNKYKPKSMNETKQIMCNEDIRKQWENFVKENAELFQNRRKRILEKH